MWDDAEEPKSRAGEPKPPKVKAEDNPWYLLATLFGVLEFRDHELRAKNRVAWNRYFAANLDNETRARLIEEKRHPAEELTPLPPEELREIATAFAERCKAIGKSLTLPESSADIDFSNVEFKQDASFNGYLFTGHSKFLNATFSHVARFDSATFSAVGNFAGATFSMAAFFFRVAFYGGALFFKAIFSYPVYFVGATFSLAIRFDDATFVAESRFVNAVMKDETSFERATFKTEPPKFFGAKLHQGTVWRRITWPPLPKNKDEAGRFIDAYACLKLEMDRLKKHDDELDFFALELQSRRIEQGLVWGLPIALYGVLSDYGRSYIRPLLVLLAVAAVGAGAFWYSGAFWYFGARAFGEALGLSVANTLNVFGFRKDFFSDSFNRLPWGLDFFAAGQTIFGTILLFLFGLGIRNRFRMK
jgi:hypothetical protein